MTDFKGFAEEYAAAWSTQNVERILSLSPKTAYYEDVALGAVNSGKEELQALV